MKGYNKTLRSLPVLKTSPQYSMPKSMPTSRESHNLHNLCTSQFVHSSSSTLLLRHSYYNLSGISRVKSVFPSPPSIAHSARCSSEPSHKSKCINSRHSKIITREQVHQQSSSADDRSVSHRKWISSRHQTSPKASPWRGAPPASSPASFARAQSGSCTC